MQQDKFGQRGSGSLSTPTKVTNIGTDVDVLVSLGYDREVARKALSVAKGDRQTALELIRTNKVELSGEWSSSTENDWVNNISSSNFAKCEIRALWKSPITIHVGSVTPNTLNEALFRCKVITHRGTFSIDKKFNDFIEFRNSLPFGSTFWFKSSFPQYYDIVDIFTFTSDSERDKSLLERKRIALDDWFREFTLNEKLMMKSEILLLIEHFFCIDESVSVLTKPTNLSTMNNNSTVMIQSNGISSSIHGIREFKPVRMEDVSLMQVIKKIRKLNPLNFPVTVSKLDEMLRNGPFKIDVSDFSELAAPMAASMMNTSNESCDIQLKKDLSRDRVIINGIRFQGNDKDGYHNIVDSSASMIQNLLFEANLLPIKDSDAIEFSKSILKQLSRTESAYLSLLCLNLLVDMNNSNSYDSNNSPIIDNMENDDSSFMGVHGGIMIIPEALLAEPMQIQMQILGKKGTSTSTSSLISSNISNNNLQQNNNNNDNENKVYNDGRNFCLDCELQTSTVYRFCDDLMNTVLQLRVIYSRRIFGMLSGITIDVVDDNEECNSVDKNGIIDNTASEIHSTEVSIDHTQNNNMINQLEKFNNPSNIIASSNEIEIKSYDDKNDHGVKIDVNIINNNV